MTAIERPADSKLWGGDDQMRDALVAGVVRSTRELIRIESPSPSVWSLIGNITDVGALNVPFVVFTLVLRIGVGRLVSTTEIVVAPNALFQVAMLPAAFISGTIRANIGAIPSLRETWDLSLWAAPFIPWEGS